MKIFKSLKEENQWMSISDLMSVLMMIFLFISIVYIRSVNLEKNKITSIARTYETTQVEITNDLKKEFTKNLQIWNAVFDSLALSIRFENPEILFKVGSAELNDHFKSILDSFFPRFIQILTDPKYKDDIEEIRIEGHTVQRMDWRILSLSSLFQQHGTFTGQDSQGFRVCSFTDKR